jgi:hypothetical protein
MSPFIPQEKFLSRGCLKEWVPVWILALVIGMELGTILKYL